MHKLQRVQVQKCHTNAIFGHKGVENLKKIKCFLLITKPKYFFMEKNAPSLSLLIAYQYQHLSPPMPRCHSLEKITKRVLRSKIPFSPHRRVWQWHSIFEDVENESFVSAHLLSPPSIILFTTLRITKKQRNCVKRRHSPSILSRSLFCATRVILEAAHVHTIWNYRVNATKDMHLNSISFHAKKYKI